MSHTLKNKLRRALDGDLPTPHTMYYIMQELDRLDKQSRDALVQDVRELRLKQQQEKKSWTR